MSAKNSNNNNESEENNIDIDYSKEEFEYEISIYANDKEIFNQIPEIKQIRTPSSINNLQIRLSNLNNLKGLNLFTNLIQLDLSNNQISSLNKAFYSLTKLKFLNLSCNKLNSLDGIEDLENLEYLNVSHNKIVSLTTFRKFVNKNNLNTINIKGNLIYDLKEFDNLVGFTKLRTLVLSEGNDTNPVCSNPNCNEYIFSVLDNKNEQNYNNLNDNNNNSYINEINEQQKKFPQTVRTQPKLQVNNIISPMSTGNIFNRPYNNNINVEDIKNKNIFNRTLGAQFTNMGMYKEEMKNLQNNIQEIYKDQKKLIVKYEQDKNEWELKKKDLQNEIEKLDTNNKSLKSKIDSLENNIKDLKYRNDDLARENREISQNYHTKELEINEISIKLAQSQKDYELLLIDKNKYNQLNKDSSNEINQLKNEIRNLKSSYDRMENSYKDIISKKSDELNERMRATSNLETKIYDLTKSITEKQKEIENLAQINSSLQNNIVRASKEKGDLEFELNKKLEEELNKNINKYKTALEEIEKKYNVALQNKTEECLNDIKALENHYETLLTDTNDELNKKNKDVEKLQYSLDECKKLLKSTLEKEEMYEAELNELKIKEKNNNEKINNLSVKNKSFELELKDINEIGNKQNNQIKQLKEEIESKEEEIISKKKEIEILNNKLYDKEGVIKDCLAQIKELNNRPDIDKLNNIINAKSQITEDQANQIIQLKQDLASEQENNKNLEEKVDSYRKKLDEFSNEIRDRDERIGEDENKLAQYEVELGENQNKLKEKEEIIGLIQNEMNDIKKIIDDNKNKLNSKSKENSILKEKVDELQKIIIQQKNDNKDIIATYEKYKNEKENEIKMVQNQNEEMKSEMQFMITEYEKIKAQNDKYQQGLLKFNQLMNLSGLGGVI